MRMNTFVDVREVLPAIRVPTAVMHRLDDRDAHVDEAGTSPRASPARGSSSSPAPITRGGHSTAT